MTKLILSFVIGVAVGCAVFAFYAHIQKQREQLQIKRLWTSEYLPQSISNYYSDTFIPIPTNLDFRHHAWSKLTYWKEFARTYTRLSSVSNFVVPQSIRTPGFSYTDPFWIEYGGEYEGFRLGEDATIKRQEGLSDSDLLTWVTTNYSYGDLEGGRQLMNRFLQTVIKEGQVQSPPAN